MIYKYLKNEKGMALPLVLMTLVVSMVLGMSVLYVSTFDQRHSIHQDHKMQAYYLAHSGAKTLSTYLVEKSYHENYHTMQQLLNDLANKTSEPIPIQGGALTVKTVRKSINGQEKLDIISKGRYGKATETVSVSLSITIQSGGGDFNPASEENALISLSEDASVTFELLNGAFVNGNVMVNTTRENAIRFSGGGYRIRGGALYIPHGTDPRYVISTDKGATNGEAPEEYKVPGEPDWRHFNNWAFWKDVDKGVKYATMPTYPSAKYPEPTFPPMPNNLPVPSNPNFSTPWVSGTYYPITEDGHYQSIIPIDGRTITVDLAGGDRTLRVGTLDLTGGNIELINVGEDSKLIFYVDDRFVLGSSRSLNGNGLPENVQIYYAGSQTVQIDGSSRFAGNIFVKEATINFTAGAHMKGNITTLGSNVNVTGGSSAHGMVLYVPRGHVEMGGSAQIRGTVIANTFRRSGGGNAGIVFTNNITPIPGDFFGSVDNKIIINYEENPWRLGEI